MRAKYDVSCVYMNAVSDVDDETLMSAIETLLKNNCFIEGRKNFINIANGVLLLVRSMDQGENVVGLFKKVSDRLDGIRSSKNIERSIRSALKGAWNRAEKRNVFDDTSLLSTYASIPRSKDFLRGVAEDVIEKFAREKK